VPLPEVLINPLVPGIYHAVDNFGHSIRQRFSFVRYFSRDGLFRISDRCYGLASGVREIVKKTPPLARASQSRGQLHRKPFDPSRITFQDEIRILIELLA
jgi:hypothetical protein